MSWLLLFRQLNSMLLAIFGLPLQLMLLPLFVRNNESFVPFMVTLLLNISTPPPLYRGVLLRRQYAYPTLIKQTKNRSYATKLLMFVSNNFRCVCFFCHRPWPEEKEEREKKILPSSLTCRTCFYRV